VTRFAIAFASFHAWPKSYTTHSSNLLYHKSFPLWAKLTHFLILMLFFYEKMTALTFYFCFSAINLGVFAHS